MAAPAPHWWQGEAALRLVRDLLAAELQRLRPGHTPDWSAWTAETPLDDRPGGLGCDSLELVTIATAVSRSYGLDRAGIDDYLLARRRLGDWAALIGEARRLDDSEIVFFTSGSTGEPKAVTHRLAGLRAEVAYFIERFGAPARILAAVPSHHIYGFLFTVLASSMAGVEVIDIRRSLPAGVGGKARKGDWIVGHPAFWTAARTADGVPGALALSSTGPMPPDVAAALRDAGWRGMEIYGSTETAGVGTRAFGSDVYDLLPLWTRDGADMLRHRDTGRKEPPPDLLDWMDDAAFRVRGRRDGAVQVGGHNVFPERVRACLLEHDDVADAAVRLMHPGEGDRLKAFVVPSHQDADVGTLRAALEDWAAAHLTPPEQPRAWRFGPALPRNVMGKPADWT